MAFKFDTNPFADLAPELPKLEVVKKSPERKPETRPGRPDLEHILGIHDLEAYLQSARAKLRDKPQEQRLIAEACDSIMGCDPWKYEPFLLDDLFRERRGASDPGAVRRLRGLIRAGSWMTYPRQTPADALADIAEIRRSEQQDWAWRLRNADPDTAKEIREDRDGQAAEFSAMEQDLKTGKTGDALEAHARNIENLLGHAWYSLKKIMAAKGLDWDQAKTDPATSRLYSEIERLRPLRDYIYFRLLYPKWAEFTKTEK